MKGKILLITTIDEAYHQPLLESQGHAVKKSRMADAQAQLGAEQYQLVVVTPDGTIDNTLAFCSQVRSKHPNLRIVLIARRSEYVPAGSPVNAIIREQGTPAQFLATIKKEIEATTQKSHAASIPYEAEDK